MCKSWRNQTIVGDSFQDASPPHSQEFDQRSQPKSTFFWVKHKFDSLSSKNRDSTSNSRVTPKLPYDSFDKGSYAKSFIIAISYTQTIEPEFS